jgi:hypothetical protein
MNENIKATGHIAWELTKADGTVEAGSKPNVVTNYGKQWMASLLGSGVTNSVWFGFGVSAGGAAGVSVTDTALFAELTTSGTSYVRVAPTKSSTAGSAVVTYVGTLSNLTSTGLTTFREVGIFASSTGTTIIAHQTTGDVQMTSTADSLQITWQITFS